VKILLTGATGYLGGAVLAACGRAGHETVAFSRHATRAALAGAAVDGDVRDLAALRSAAAGCDAICHTAALVSVWRKFPSEFDEVNVGGLRNVIEVTRRLRIPRLVCTSSFLALPAGGEQAPGRWNDYQRTKVLADMEAARAVEDGAPIVRLYPGVMYGPGAMTEGNLLGGMIADHVRRRLAGLVGADRVWSFAYVEDVAAAHVTALERGVTGGRYFVGGPNAPQRAAFEIVRELTGLGLPRRIPVGLARAVARLEEVRARLFGRPPLLTGGTVEILRRDWPLDSRIAEQELDYRITPLRDGVRSVLEGLGVELLPAVRREDPQTGTQE